MYKIKFIPTGHIFVLPNNDAKKLKEENPNEYLILEKNGKKFKDKEIKIINKEDKEANKKCILSLVLDKS